MIGAVGIGPHKRVEIIIRGGVRTWRHFRPAQLVKGALRRNLAGDPDAVPEYLAVDFLFQPVQPHDRRRQWIGTRQPHPAAACRLHWPDIEAIAVQVGWRRPAVEIIRPEMILDVRIRDVFCGAKKGADPAWRRRGGAGPRQEPLQADGSHTVRFQQSVPRCAGCRAVLDMNFQMVVKILTDTGKVMADGNAVRLQLFCRTDSRQHQDLRRLHRACRQDQFGIAMGFLFAAVPDEGGAVDPAALHQQAGDMRACQHRQVRPLPDAADQGRRGRPLTIGDVDVECGAAILVGPVIVLRRAIACLVDSLEKGLFHRVQVGHSADRDRAGIAAIGIAATQAGLHRPEMGQHIRIAPALGAAGLPPVEILAVAADKHHAVQR